MPLSHYLRRSATALVVLLAVAIPSTASAQTDPFTDAVRQDPNTAPALAASERYLDLKRAGSLDEAHAMFVGELAPSLGSYTSGFAQSIAQFPGPEMRELVEVRSFAPAEGEPPNEAVLAFRSTFGSDFIVCTFLLFRGTGEEARLAAEEQKIMRVGEGSTPEELMAGFVKLECPGPTGVGSAQ